MHEVLESYDSYQALIFDYRDDAQIASCQLAKRGCQGFLLLCDFKYFVHDGLNVAVALRAKGLQDFLSRDHSHHVGATDDGEVVLQGVHGLIEGFFEGVGWRERGERREYPALQAAALDGARKQ